MPDLLNFRIQFVKYGEFHANKVNQIIHIIFVPIILWSVLVWLSATPNYYNYSYQDIMPINGAFIAGSVYALYYLLLHPVIGFMSLPYLYAILYLANLFYKTNPNSITISIIAHISSWFFQILGHQVFEGRAPAFTQDPIQALVLAPLFVFCEVLFGIGMFPTLNRELDVQIKQKSTAFKKASKKTK